MGPGDTGGCFFEYVLPFANLNEKRESWRKKDFYYRFSDIMRNSASGYQAAASLNNKMFEMVGVKYSTKRPKADHHLMRVWMQDWRHVQALVFC